MVVGILVILLGLGGIALGGLQLGGALPVPRSGGRTAFTAYVNVLIGIFLIALGILRLKGLL